VIFFSGLSYIGQMYSNRIMLFRIRPSPISSGGSSYMSNGLAYGGGASAISGGGTSFFIYYPDYWQCRILKIGE